MHGWQANEKRTCAPPVLLGLCPKMKYHPLCGWIFIGDPDENHPLNGAVAPTARTRAPKQSTGLFLSLRSRPVRFSCFANRKRKTACR